MQQQPLCVGGSPGRTRTCDQPVNSRLLYQLSYRGTRQFVARLRILTKDIGWGETFFYLDVACLARDTFTIRQSLRFRPHSKKRQYCLLQQMRSASPRSDRGSRYPSWYRQP